MSCYRPLKAYRTATGVSFSQLRRDDHVGDIEIPCGQCIGCRMRRASDWELRVMHEASLWDENCFVTLTYGRDRLPANGSLDHGDVQRFLKRVRKEFSGRVVRFYMCGEYGPLNLRPHYHMCLFNVNFYDRIPSGKSASGAVFYDSPKLERLWSHGRVSVQDLTRETAGYCARYIMKKALGANADAARERVLESGEIVQVKAEYSAMSLKPGIGAGWFAKYGNHVVGQDFVVGDGKKRQMPKYYDKLAERANHSKLDEIEFSRYLKARDAAPDNTDERRRVREIVHEARVRNLNRGLE